MTNHTKSYSMPSSSLDNFSLVHYEEQTHRFRPSIEKIIMLMNFVANSFVTEHGF